MGRRTSGATVGIEKIGLVQADQNTLTTSQPNQNLVVSPNGTGITQSSKPFMVMGNGTTGGEIRLGDADSTHWTILRTAANTTANRTLTFPDSAGGVGQVLQTDGAGNLSWVAQTTAGVSASDPGTSATTHYLFFGTNSGSILSGQVTAINNRSNLSFVPSTGALTSTEAFHGTVTGGTTSSANLVLRSTTNATKGQVFIDENTSSTSTTTGALRVAGGVGVAGQVTCGTLSAGTITETSSIALKENIDPITNALDKILQLQGYIYDRKDGSRLREAGLIKEEVEKVIPNIVNDDGIQYTKLSAFLIEAVKTLKSEIDELRSKTWQN